MDLKTPFTMLVAGPSGSGKSTLIAKMIGTPTCFDRPPTNVIIAYSKAQSLYGDLIRNAPVPVRLVRGLPENLETRPDTLLIIDDLQQEADKTVCDWFTKDAHHRRTSVIYLVQNIFLKSPQHRTASLNAHYIVLFKNPRDSTQIRHLSAQFAPTNPAYVVDAFRQATTKPHGYLLFDFKQDTDELLRIRDSVFSDAHVFTDKSIGTPFELSSLAANTG